MAFGTIGGVNKGKTSNPVFGVNAVTGVLDPTTTLSTTKTEFTQTYGGVYMSANRGRFFADLQYRYEDTEFSTTNTAAAAGNPTLGLNNTTYKSEANTISGSVGYAFPIERVSGLAFVPTAGFAITKTRLDNIVNASGDVLATQDRTSRTAFAGATLSRSRIAEDGQSAINYFATATYYHDFSDELQGTFTSGGTPSSFTIDNLGSYGELSAGINYTKLLNPGQLGRARQFDASLRVDGRKSGNLESWGITGQVRFQF